MELKEKETMTNPKTKYKVYTLPLFLSRLKLYVTKSYEFEIKWVFYQITYINHGNWNFK